MRKKWEVEQRPRSLRPAEREVCCISPPPDLKAEGTPWAGGCRPPRLPALTFGVGRRHLLDTENFHQTDAVVVLS